eukprot:3084590-Prorocentrum_lima.AAC.1
MPDDPATDHFRGCRVRDPIMHVHPDVRDQLAMALPARALLRTRLDVAQAAQHCICHHHRART